MWFIKPQKIGCTNAGSLTWNHGKSDMLSWGWDSLLNLSCGAWTLCVTSEITPAVETPWKAADRGKDGIGALTLIFRAFVAFSRV